MAGGNSRTSIDTGCLFRDRCPAAMEICRDPVPVFAPAPGHTARCWLHQPDRAVPNAPDRTSADRVGPTAPETDQ